MLEAECSTAGSANVKRGLELFRPAKPGLLRRFAERHRIRTRLDDCGDLIIPGRKTATDLPNRIECRNHVYDHGDGKRLGLSLMFPTKARWTYAKKKLAAAGFTLKQDGDTEGVLLFDPGNSEQARVAMKVVGVKKRRIASPAQLRAARKGLEAALFHRKPLAEGVSAP